MTDTVDERARAAALVIGTRGSPLALVQSELVRRQLMVAHPGLNVSLEVIRTTGDRILGQPLAAIGGKSLFTKEIEEALLDGRVDIAVHSMKDVPSDLPGGLGIPCILEREDVRDVLIVHDDTVARLDDLPQGARLGTASLRRAAQALSRRPDLAVVGLRGNVGTRLDKIKAGEADATFLALAGLKRLGMEDAARIILTTEEMLPAVAQGAIGIECREDDSRMHELLAPLDHAPTRICVAAERAVLRVLEGSCRMPIAALATVTGTDLLLRAMIASPDGRQRFDVQRSAPMADALALGSAAGDVLRAEAGADFIAALGHEA